jgi:hypothetical protein
MAADLACAARLHESVLSSSARRHRPSLQRQLVGLLDQPVPDEVVNVRIAADEHDRVV